MPKEDELVEKFSKRLFGIYHHPQILEAPRILADIRASNLGPRGINRLIETLPHGLTGISGDTLRSVVDQLRDLRDERKATAQPASAPLLGRKVRRPKSADVWRAIEADLGVSKRGFARKIRFIQPEFKRNVIFRDVEDSFILASSGFPKAAVILAGSVIEELLRLYLASKHISVAGSTFDAYIQACVQHRLLKSAISRLSDSVRQFRNLVHLSNEETRKHTIAVPTAKGAVTSIFTVANDF